MYTYCVYNDYALQLNRVRFGPANTTCTCDNNNNNNTRHLKRGPC